MTIIKTIINSPINHKNFCNIYSILLFFLIKKNLIHRENGIFSQIFLLKKKINDINSFLNFLLNHHKP